tara:strand:- start:526 stop:918 length:393 start_codon:yes stop_codon:yes gene_type:complete
MKKSISLCALIGTLSFGGCTTPEKNLNDFLLQNPSSWELVHHLNKLRGHVSKPTFLKNSPVLYDHQERVSFMNSSPVQYDDQGRISFIDKSPVLYDGAGSITFIGSPVQYDDQGRISFVNSSVVQYGDSR